MRPRDFFLHGFKIVLILCLLSADLLLIFFYFCADLVLFTRYNIKKQLNYGGRK